MSKHIDLFPTVTNDGALRQVIRNSTNQRAAQMRSIRLPQPTHQELVKLGQRLFLSGPASSQVVVFSAVEPGNGCSFVCARTAEILANDPENSVCLIDANFRSPGLEDQFEFEEALTKPRGEEWRFTPVKANSGPAGSAHLWLLSYRPERADSCPTIASLERFQTLLSELRKEFTHVLIDAPPLNGYADAAIFGRMADGLVMVLAAHGTRREAAQKAKEMLETSGVPVLGAVLNKRTFPIPEYLYRRL